MIKKCVLLLLLSSLFACESKLGKFEDDVLFSIQTNDSVEKALQMMDTAVILKLRSQSKIMLLKFNIELGNDTLDIKTTRQIDDFIQAYRSTDFFTSDIAQLRIAQQEQKNRLILLKTDIETGAGDRSMYYENVQKELSEAKEIRAHCVSLEKQFNDFKQSYQQFKPTFERFKVQH